jgi:hypothetical protein
MTFNHVFVLIYGRIIITAKEHKKIDCKLCPARAMNYYIQPGHKYIKWN